MPKDVTILTGFLGAGKTTLLNALMNARPHTRFALIENEFGKEGIDGDMVIRPDVDIVELSNGCLCCSLNDDLLTVLEELHDRSDRFDELIIETTGIADPANVALPFLMLPTVQRDFSLKRVVCLVDAELVEDQLRDTEEAIAQISFSDLIIINKTDRVSPDTLAKLVELLQGMNPMAQILTGQKEDYPIGALMAFARTTLILDKPGRFTPSRPVAQSQTIRPRSSASGAHHHHHKHSDIVSLSFRFTESMDLTSLYHRLMTLLLFQGQAIYRVKGIIYDQTRRERWIIQSVGKNITLLEGTPWQDDEEQLSRVVIIGKLLKPEDFEKMLRQCLSKDSSWQITNSTTLLKTPTL